MREVRHLTREAIEISIPHDEAFKKLLETFYQEFIDLFFPELGAMLDYSETRFLMQELLVDIVGEEARELDLLLETRYKGLDGYILIHLEPQSYKDHEFRERMFIYFSRLFERYRKDHKLIIPIAIFTSDEVREEQDTLEMSIPEHSILRFQFLKVELRKQNWRRFIDSDNAVAAALLAKMGYTTREAREVRREFLRMFMKLRARLDQGRLALIMSVADLYFKPDRAQDEEILRELIDDYSEEGEVIMELMPAWKRWGYEEGIAEGMEKGIEKGKAEGKEEGQAETIRKLLLHGFSPEVVSKAVELPLDEIKKLM
ncbi:Rpn family recombination-promoting nuclease/putative transposase [Paenibacillus silagei]|uniref:Transposase/invertase (TIGR01784 family) n=1 Tax=Paenibacillus silagei TaxID=1670801 RepID=A0ABS4NQW3_9BACL|nr:Rpn family recombination-promoting nuclease/putative transposase [Paenibacillus silagei]MBP2112459.1 putative transposase/invertase (TIGR01784 family) [Paenibacillus silagei]